MVTIRRLFSLEGQFQTSPILEIFSAHSSIEPTRRDVPSMENIREILFLLYQ